MRVLRSQSRSDCYPIWLNMHSHSREATGTPRLINIQSRSREATVAQSQSQCDCYPILLNMQSHSREATVMPRRCGVAASLVIFIFFKTVFANFETFGANLATMGVGQSLNILLLFHSPTPFNNGIETDETINVVRCEATVTPFC